MFAPVLLMFANTSGETKETLNMSEEGLALIEGKIQQAIALIERLKTENENLKKEIVKLQDEIQQLKEEASIVNDERESLKEKIDSAVSRLDKVNLDDVRESIAEEVTKETEEDS